MSSPYVDSLRLYESSVEEQESNSGKRACKKGNPGPEYVEVPVERFEEITGRALDRRTRTNWEARSNRIGYTFITEVIEPFKAQLEATGEC